MKNLKWWGMTGVAVVGITLAACGSKSSSSDSASLRIVNATLTHPSLDLLINATASVSGTTTDTVSAYVSPASGGNTLQVNDAGGGTALTTIVPTLTGGAHYTLFAYESSGAVKTVVLNEDQLLPALGVATLKIFNTAVDAGPIDVYIATTPCTSANIAALSPSTTFGTLTGPQAVTLTQGAGTFNVCVTAAGSKTDLRMSLPITLVSQQIATVLLTPASGGALINGSLLTQQAGYLAVRNTNTRVRLAAAVSGGATVSATSSDGTAIGSGVAPLFGFYTLVPATSTLNVVVASLSVQVAAPTTLPLGGDVTLLVYGNPGSATASLVVDDNRLPSVATASKLRLINGVTGNVGNLTLTANSSPVGINVAPGTASSSVSLTSTATSATTANTFSFSLSSSTAGQLTLPASSATGTVNSSTSYSVLAVGDVSAPLLLIR